MANAPPRRALSTAIVIPTWNEVVALEGLLPTLTGKVEEIVVCDGGSTDATVTVAERHGARVVTSPPGRGIQLNAGAGAVEGAELLIFLHADTRLEDGALAAATRAVEKGAVGGGFEVRFDYRAGALKLGDRLINLRTRLTLCPLGDQAQFVTREVFQQMNGFRNWPILEDLDFARRLKKQGRVAVVTPPVTTSARRFVKNGTTRTIATNWLIWALYFLGVSPHRLGRLYKRVR